MYLGRKYNEPISYICVMELHKSGIPHLHALVDRYIHQRWISQAWEAVGGGPIVFIKRVEKLADAGKYLAKYLTKKCSGRSLRRFRRISTSRDIKLRRFDAGGKTWEVSPIGMDMLEKIGADGITAKLHDGNGFLREMVAEYAIDHTEAEDTTAIRTTALENTYCRRSPHTELGGCLLFFLLFHLWVNKPPPPENRDSH